MKRFRFAGLFVIALSLSGGTTETARATAPINCYVQCSGGYYQSQCWASLERCCSVNRCPIGQAFYYGDCTDGTNYCPV